MLNITRILVIVLSVVSLSACQHKSKDKLEEKDPKIAYQKAIELLEKFDYKNAGEYFTKVYFLDPSSSISQKSQLLEIYSFFMAKKYDESIEASDNFLKFYPLHKYSDYAAYMNALCHYVQINPIYLDQSFTKRTKILFEDFINSYPDSKFIEFAKDKIILLNEYLSAKEMDIGRYYMFLNDPMSSIPRFQTVLHDYSQTNQIQEALYRLSASFKMLGLENEAIKYAAILGHNFPDSKWYKYSYSLLKNVK
jgi:outer membrane protein assembly factor BamD